MKKGIAIGFLLAMMSVVGYANENISFDAELASEINKIQIIDSADLTMEDLQNRNGNIIIEKCIGTLLDADGNGKVLNYADPDYYYISYKSVANANIGDIIMTYFIYNPDNNIEDDILFRIDYIIA